MQKRYLAIGALGCSAVWATAGQMGSSTSGLDFTKPALPAPVAIDLRAPLSASYVVLPVEIGPLAKRAEQGLPEKLAVVRDVLSDAACGKRTTSVDCTDARLEGTLTRTGPVEMKVGASAIKLSFPVKYDLTATGIGWASHLSEHKTGETTVAVSFSVSVNSAGGLDVANRDEPGTVEAPVSLLKGNVKVGRLIEAKVKPVAKRAEEDLRRAVGALPVKSAVHRAWAALSQSLELGQGSGLWLKGGPEHITTGNFVSEGGKLSFRVGIASRMAIAEAERTQLGGGTKRSLVASQDSPPPGPARVRMAMPVDLEAMRQVAETVFPRSEVFESRADRFSEPVKVKVRGTRVYPALRQIGLELDVEVTTHKGVKHSGKLHLAGRPVLDAAAGTVTLADITFPPVSGKDAGGQVSGLAPGIPRLGTEPFASRFAAAAKLDISRPMAEALPRAMHVLNQRIGEDMALEARLKQVVPVSLELARDGAWLMVDLVGDVAFVHDGIAVDPSEAAAAKAEDAKEPAPNAGSANSHVAKPKAAAEAKRPAPAKQQPAEAKKHAEPKHATPKAAEHKSQTTAANKRT